MNKHGTRSCYRHGCRLSGCVAANTEYTRGLRARRTVALAQNPGLKPHGSASTYVNWGCRCVECCKAHSVWLSSHREGSRS